MAAFERVGNILLVYGNDVYTSDYRIRTRDFLYGARSSPVQVGTHDFWITYAIPSLGGAEWNYEDLSARPRKMRGIIRMGSVPDDTTPSTLQRHLNVILQEVAHHWLVPYDLEVSIDGTEVGLANGLQMTQQINDETPFTEPALLGRANSHWTAYFQSDASPMDGMYYVDAGSEDGFNRWQQSSFVGPTLTPSGLPSLSLVGSYNDLDLLVMGVKTAAEAYPATGSRFRWLEPKLSTPYPAHIGVFVAFSRNDFFYFGFYTDHRLLGVERTGDPIGGELTTLNLGPDYHPLGNDYNGIALRVVRRGNQYYFQARHDNPQIGCVAAVLNYFFPRLFPRSLRLFEDIDSLPLPNSTASFNRFRTVAIYESSDRPQAVGLIVKKWRQPHLAEGAFYNFELLSGKSHTILQTDDVPEALPPGTPYSSLPLGELRLDNPTGDAIVRSKGGRLHILTPFSTVNPEGNLEHFSDNHFDHDANLDNAPKALTKAPNGDFAFATSCKVYRTIFTPWAAGYATGKTMWGNVKTARALDIIVPPRIITEKQPPPPDNTYKIAYIIVAERRSDITEAMIQRVDIIRRYWDSAFEAATVERRHSNSML
ncbi:MAG: hypothetical protein FIB03_14280 [Anaerolineae bacterium]|nr:hypothetical protein [Anaerolineae bacterium]